MANFTRVLPNLDPNARYIIRVRAYNNISVGSEWSESFSFETPVDDSVPGPVTGLTSAFLGSAVVLTWTAPTTNVDGSTIVDLDHYKITITDGSITKEYETRFPPFVYSLQQNEDDFGTAQSSLTFTVVVVDVEGNESEGVTVGATNAIPPNPTEAPILTGVFNGINITMIPPAGMLDYGGFYLEHSLTGVGAWSLIADITTFRLPTLYPTFNLPMTLSG